MKKKNLRINITIIIIRKLYSNTTDYGEIFFSKQRFFFKVQFSGGSFLHYISDTIHIGSGSSDFENWKQC